MHFFMKEYRLENGEVDIKQLKAETMDKKSYSAAHEGLVIPCHDIFVEYNHGILLIERLNFPAKGILWPLGGRILRGLSTEDSSKDKVLVEAGLLLEDLIELGHARTYFKTDPFGHGKGTDTINIIFFGRGKGQLALDRMHEKPRIIYPENYDNIKSELHPYVRDFMDLAIPRVR